MDTYETQVKDTARYKQAKKVLKDKFGYKSFKPYQYQIIDNVLQCKDVLAIMPTGYGKSLCFQIIPLLTNEVAIVISPLIALMTDQKMILDKLGITSCCYNSTMGQKKKTEIETDLVEGKYQIMYITPESLVNAQPLVNKIYKTQGICMIAIDEAHCVSSYGFDFRPKYRDIVKLRSILENVPVMAVTATATDKVATDIISVMKMSDCDTIKTSFDRPNLKIHVKLQSANTMDEITQIIKDSTGPCIVYCLTKGDTESMADKLTFAGVESRAYHAGLAKDDRTSIQEEFMNGSYTCICATIAFGMGINKTNIRVVIHFGCPQNIESYYQEIGRAGRDGIDSDCYMFYRQKDFMIQQLFIKEIKDPRYKTVRNVLLHKISQYVNLSGCRRKFILNYFGQEINEINCGNCDNCISFGTHKIIDKRDEFKLFQVLNTILEIKSLRNISFGINVIGLILKGSESVKIKTWMRDLTYYRVMKAMTIKEINGFIYKTLDYGYIENHDIGDCVHVLRCTEQGMNFGKKYEEKINQFIQDENDIVVEHFDL